MRDKHKLTILELTIGKKGQTKHWTKKKKTNERLAEGRNERTKEWQEEQTDERMNDIITVSVQPELPADWSRVFQREEKPWVQIWLITMTDLTDSLLSSVSSIF